MKKILCVFLYFSFAAISVVRAQNPVAWSFFSKKVNATTYEIHLTAKIETDWHIYSQTTPEGGPVATSVSFNRNPLVIFDGPVKEAGKMEQHFEELFGVDVKQFSTKVDFIQLVKLKMNAKTNVSGMIEFMTCNDRECMPPKKVNFTISLGK